jgi:glycerol-3-phosphate acyltransferase PlsX
MRIAVDAMGGDHAPVEVIKGALLVAREDPATEILLLGIADVLKEALSGMGEIPQNLSCRGVPEVIAMDEHPIQAVRKKRNSSLVSAALLVKSGEADAAFSAGNTGAAMAAATLDIGRVPGVDRPAIAATMPTLKSRALLLDAGANVDCTPENLRQFAKLGAVYVECVWGVASPRIGLLNIGSEQSKGNELTKAAFPLLQKDLAGFVGNLEGRDIFDHAADVVVCDGFAGNLVLKTGEGTAEFIVALMQQEMAADPLLAAAHQSVMSVLSRLQSRIDYAEYGAAPLLGVNGVSMIGHGRSHARAIASGIRAARDAAAAGYIAAVREAL